MSGFDSIPVLEKMISAIEKKYKPNGEWITSEGKEKAYYNKNISW
jgi:hypothetical protein